MYLKVRWEIRTQSLLQESEEGMRSDNDGSHCKMWLMVDVMVAAEGGVDGRVVCNCF